MPISKSLRSPLSCPNCGGQAVVTKTAVNTADLKRHTRRSSVWCPNCKMSLKEAVNKKFKTLYDSSQI